MSKIKRWKYNDKFPFLHPNDKNGEYVLYDDIKHLLNTSDNSDYEVTPTDSPKLPSLEDVKESLGYGYDKEGYVEATYQAIKKLGNFA